MILLAVQESLFSYFPSDMMYIPEFAYSRFFSASYSSFFGISSLEGSARFSNFYLRFGRVSSEVGDSLFSDMSLEGAYRILNRSLGLYGALVYSSTKVDEATYSSISFGVELERTSKRSTFRVSAYNLVGAKVELESGDFMKVPFTLNAETMLNVGEKLTVFGSYWMGLFNYYTVGALMRFGEFLKVGAFYSSSAVAPYGVIVGYTKDNLAFHLFYAFSDLKYLKVSVSFFR